MKSMQAFTTEAFATFLADNYETLVRTLSTYVDLDDDAAKDLVHDFAVWGLEKDWEAYEAEVLAEGRIPRFDVVRAKLKCTSMYRDKTQRTLESQQIFIDVDLVGDLEDDEGDALESAYQALAEAFDGDVSKVTERVLAQFMRGDDPCDILIRWQEHEHAERRALNRIDRLSPQQYDIMRRFQDDQKSSDIADELGFGRAVVAHQVARACEKLYADEEWLRPIYHDWQNPTDTEKEAHCYIWNGLHRTEHATPGTPQAYTLVLAEQDAAATRYGVLVQLGKFKAASKLAHRHGLEVWSDPVYTSTGRPAPVLPAEIERDYFWQGARRLHNCLGIDREVSVETIAALKRHQILGD